MTAMISTALAMTHQCGFRISLAPGVCAAPDGLLHRGAAVGPGQRNASQRHIAAVQVFQIDAGAVAADTAWMIAARTLRISSTKSRLGRAMANPLCRVKTFGVLELFNPLKRPPASCKEGVKKL